MSRDLELLIKYHSPQVSLDEFNGFTILQSVISGDHNNINDFNTIDLINLDQIKKQTTEIIDYLVVKQRYRKLQILFSGKMYFVNDTHPHFEVDGHQFQTLDEVQKVWDNKVFL